MISDFADSRREIVDENRFIASSRRPKIDPPERAPRDINGCAGEGGQNTAEMESIRAARCQGLPGANFNFDTDRPPCSPFLSLFLSVSHLLINDDMSDCKAPAFMRFDRSPASNEVGDSR